MNNKIWKEIKENVLNEDEIELFYIPDEIYHYTSLNSLESIVKTNTFWATESRFMNDAGEVSYFKELVIDLLPILLKEFPTHKEAVTKIHENLIKLLNNNKVKNLNQDDWLYILSFSKNKDSLSMWNYYGKNDGYCIGINGEKFLQLFSDKPKEELSNEYKFYPLMADVIYDRNEQLDILFTEFDKCFVWYIDNYSVYGESCIPDLASALLYKWRDYSPFFKHPSFEVEGEYRIVFEASLLEFDPSYRNYQGIMAPYIEVKFKNKSLPINSITVGPMIKHDQAHIGLLGWLSKLQFKDNLNIEKSTIPLRF
ncbi:DUF2971 domain-containing protein [Paenibacillus hunanensis]|uniref:DUF2971 domain-containing protein n=1 Tax=Paenibacillus hunanensis TaxID=539262 RepID=UPI002026EC6E|nr:DUF2971 domain-containing protein [Paenibacillus hunanensis]MCL9662205.1 DUF2971 domain-containing protein [Paenibacillus hunanensis]